MKWYEKQKQLFKDQESKENNTNDTSEATNTSYEEDGNNGVVNEDYRNDNSSAEVQVPGQNDYAISDDDGENGDPITNEEVLETRINRDASIHGDLELSGDLNLSGKIIGNITCCGNVYADGVIEGNVSACNIILNNAKITGNIECQETLELHDDTSITGDIVCTTLSCEGSIHGDIHAENEILLLSNAVVEGNVVAKYLQSERGAVLKGQYQIISD